jgi:hypothetical protein
MKLNSTHFCFVKIKMLKCGGGDGSLGGGDMGGRGLLFLDYYLRRVMVWGVKDD